MGRVVIVQPDADAVLHIAQRLRARDRAELHATAWDESPAAIAQAALAAPGWKALATLDGEPVFVGGAAAVSPGVAQLWGWGTDRAAGAMKAITRQMRTACAALLTGSSGVHRVQAVALASTAQPRWLAAAGLTHSVALPALGKGREDFVMLYAVREH